MAVKEDAKKLVLARLETMPPNLKLAFGGVEALAKDDIIRHIKSGDALGDKFVQMQLLYLRNIAKQYG